jgi:CelD/BcsL family acetyltransferase involved in cellulose biosynthesis
MNDQPPLRVEEITDETAFFAFGDEWRRLFDATPDTTPFQSWEWLSTWWKFRGRGRPLALVALEEMKPLCAMALAVTPYRHTPLRLVRWMGAPNSDYHDFVGGERRDECAAAFLAHLGAKRDWHVCDLSELRGETLAALSAPLGARSCDQQPCATIILPPTQEEYRRRLGGNHRSAIKRNRARIEADHRAVAFTTVDAAQDLPGALADLFRLHTARLRERGQSGAFATESARAFHCEVASKFLERDCLRLHRLMIDGECRAALYCFRHGATVYYYLGGFDREFQKYGPGTLLLNHAVECAIGEGAREFDLMRGDEAYKSRWKSIARDNGRIIFGRGGFASRVAVGCRLLERRIFRLREAFAERAEARRRAPHRVDQSSNTPSRA